MMKKFSRIYALTFSLIWIGYGLYSVISEKPSGFLILGFGIAFSVVIFAASWFSQWLFKKYKDIDKQSKEILSHS